MAVIKKTRDDKRWGGGDVEKREMSSLVGGTVNWCSHEGKVWRIPKKLKIELPYDPGILLPEMSE